MQLLRATNDSTLAACFVRKAWPFRIRQEREREREEMVHTIRKKKKKEGGDGAFIFMFARIYSQG